MKMNILKNHSLFQRTCIMTVTLEVDFDFRALVNRIVLYLSIYSLVVVNESGDEYSMAQNLTHHNLSFIAQMGKY